MLFRSGFAPAFAGQRVTREYGWEQLRQRQRAFVAEAPQLNALIFAVEGDAYESPDELRFLQKIPGVTLVELQPSAVDGARCESGTAHSLAYRGCFLTQRERILRFIEERLP